MISSILPKETYFFTSVPLHTHGIFPGTEVDIAKEGEKYVIVVDPIETVKRKWRGRFRGGETPMEYLDEVSPLTT